VLSTTTAFSSASRPFRLSFSLFARSRSLAFDDALAAASFNSSTVFLRGSRGGLCVCVAHARTRGEYEHTTEVESLSTTMMVVVP